eukprot:TRINITY_DN4757_c0_g1_i11.p1 TRINITY_DN4757_c0_g1~~TRINITY_DN4757_c0_g1_i11.p1  ORF type:complete len:380 (-),score=41.51 TRINITY_DN4757_c0_g1_i11:160-1299(-)
MSQLDHLDTSLACKFAAAPKLRGCNAGGSVKCERELLKEIPACADCERILPLPPAVDQSSEAGEEQKKIPRGHVTTRKFKCNLCLKLYSTSLLLSRHIKIKHAANEKISRADKHGQHVHKRDTSKNRSCSDMMRYFRSKKMKGGPTVVLYGFKESFDLLAGSCKNFTTHAVHPLYIELYKLHLLNVHIHNYASHPFSLVSFTPPSGYPVADYNPKNIAGVKHCKQARSEDWEMCEEDEPLRKRQEIMMSQKRRKHCDEILAEYLNVVAREVRREIYADVLKFVLLFREYLNDMGREKKRGGRCSSDGVNRCSEEEEEDYCLYNNIECAPEIVNEFITVVLSKVKLTFENIEAIDLVQHLCDWLFENGYTCSKIMLMKDK